jgi:hypothetical protein
MKLLGTIEGNEIIEHEDGRVTWTAKLAVDNDGSDNRQGDPYWQRDTSLHHNGRPIDSEAVAGIVVPPLVINAVASVVLGCKASVKYLERVTDAVVFDIGPRKKIGEGSPELARRLGINPSAINGGIDAHVVEYTIWPGVPAVVDDVTYELQPS